VVAKILVFVVVLAVVFVVVLAVVFVVVFVTTGATYAGRNLDAFPQDPPYASVTLFY
jgi:flagellar basal body-associated protein FliL